MSQGVLGFKYEEERHDTGMTGLAGLPVYLDLLDAMGFPELIGGHLQVKQRGWMDAQMVLALMLLNIAGGRGLRGGSWEGSEGRGVLQDPAPGGATGDETVGAMRDGAPLAEGAESCGTFFEFGVSVFSGIS